MKIKLRPHFLFLIHGCIAIDSNGIQFFKFFNSLLWVWPWRRHLNNGMKWYSYVFEAPFSTVKKEKEEIDKYIKAILDSFPKASYYDNSHE